MSSALPSRPPLALVPEPSRLGVRGRVRLRATALVTRSPYWIGRVSRAAPRWIGYTLRDLLVGMLRVVVACWHWMHLSEERADIRLMDGRDARAKAKRDVNKDARFRLISVGIVAGVVALAHLVVYLVWYPWWQLLTLGEVLVLLALFEYVGRRPRPDQDDGKRRGPLTHGTSSRSLRRDLIEGFRARKILDVAVVGPVVNKYGWSGSFETESKIDDELIAHLERWVHAPPGSLMVRIDSRNSASRPFTLLIEDPLATPSVPEEPSQARDICARARIGRHLFGKSLMVNLRQHIGLIGRSGSGKSSGLWVLIDWITSCFNAEVDGIDITGGPAFTVWRGAVRRRGSTPAEAASILDEAIELVNFRVAELGRLAESDQEMHDENWAPTDGVDGAGRTRKARYVMIDEFHVLADDKMLMERVKYLIRVGRKACVYVVLATPGVGKEDLGTTVIKAMLGLKILFACVIHDVTGFLGGRMAEAGWRPDKLAPAAAEGDPRDAGKAFVWDGEHQEPEVVRISRLSLAECRRRARNRLGAKGAGAATTSEAPVIALLRAAFTHYEREALPTSWILEFTSNLDSPEGAAPPLTWDASTLASRAKDAGVPTSRQLGRDRAWSGNPRGYLLSDVRNAATGSSG